MKTGVIIIFYNNEKDIDVEFFIENLNNSRHLEFCLVNNNSNDITYNILKKINEHCSNVSVVDIKKFKSETSAIRAGVRYMINRYNIERIGYVNTDSVSKEINNVIKKIVANEEGIINDEKKVIQRKETKKTLFQSLFSLLEYLKELKVEKQSLRLSNQ